MNLIDSDQDVRRQIYDAYDAMRPADRKRARWVMPREWLERIKALDPDAPSWPRILIGIPITVTPHATEPYLVKVVN
jgi:hypothetical protein